MINASVSKRTLFFKQPAGTSRGVLTEKEVYFLTLFEKENPSKRGIGEIAPLPKLSPDALPNLEEILTELVKKINRGEEIPASELDDFPAVRFGYETALKGLETGSPVLLYPTEFTQGEKGIPINGLIWMGTKDFMVKQVEEKLAAGFTCLKLKIGAIDFESELDILRSIRKRFPVEQLEIRVDANGAFPAEKALFILEELATFNLHSIEQPIKAGQIYEIKKLCKETPLPIALDEELIGISALKEKEQLLDEIQPQYIILKPTLTGGIKASEEWISLAEKRGIGWWVTSALESNIGLNAIAQWTATLKTNNFQGLGTGALFTNNVKSPLYVSEGYIRYNSNENWDLKLL
ncbi:o-succinylbenzoate synthase [Maribellus comscasis]|uniref:o-succinylbenzoate synthase n=1 Tax=Maribellus comscasis TaxID=2681766 RepID=A0A6I6JP21_9BACT|nr:o-succinylbenzoate synthase [Maribellus comscasis]QGY44695.1 o-succinylbenzoate synthase [Maribellus comscasis]